MSCRVPIHGRPVILPVLAALTVFLAGGRPEASTCTSPIPIGEGIHSGSTAFETSGGNASCDSQGSAPAAWYRHTATCDGELHVETCGSSFDTIVSVHADLCPAGVFTELPGGCNEDCPAGGAASGQCGAQDSCATVSVTQGQTVLIRVSGAGGGSGDFELLVSCQVPNDECGDAESASAGTTIPGSTLGATFDSAATCYGVDQTAPGVWYTVVGNGNILEASTCNAGTSYDSKLSVYCAGCGGQQCITANDDACGLQSRVSWCSTPGEIYHVLVHGYGQAEGPFDLEIVDTGTTCGPFYADCMPANDTCQDALTLTGQVLGDNTSANTDGSATCQASHGDVWYEWEHTCHGFVTYDTCEAYGTLADTVLSVQEGCGGTELACNDDAAGCGLRSSVSLPIRPGLTHTIRVADYGGDGADEGSFILRGLGAVTSPVVPWPGLYAAADRLCILEHHHDGFVEYPGYLTPADVRGLAWGTGMGLLFGIDHATSRIVQIDPNTAQVSPGASYGSGDFRSLAWDPERSALFTVDAATGTLILLDPFTGRQTPLFGVGTLGIEALAYRPDTETLYAWDTSAQDLMIIRPFVPSVSWVGLSTSMQFRGLAWDEVKDLLYGMGRQPGMFEDVTAIIDPAAGTVTLEAIAWNLGSVVEGLTALEGLPLGSPGQPYAHSLPISGGCPSYIVTSPAGLPPGFSLDQGGLLTGTPVETGIYYPEFDVVDTDIGTPIQRHRTVLRVPPGNDLCSSSESVTDGTTAFSTGGALTDGPTETGACFLNLSYELFFDVWFTYQATCTGNVTIDTCGSGYNTKMAVYDGAMCPQSPSALACDDSSCSNQHARVTLPVAQGEILTLRVGGYGWESGPGMLNISCAPVGACCGAAGGCGQEEQPDCQDTGGVYLGDGAACSPDTDGDGWNDTCENCPSDPGKTDPGVCGCGVPDGDLDGDTIPDCIDTDKDGDGILDVNDWEPLNRLACRDDDGDSCDDCSSGTYDVASDGADTDGDGICDLTDCADGDAGTWRLPREAENLAIAPDQVSLSWDPPSDPGGHPSGTLYDLVRGFTADDFTAAACMETDTSFTTAAEPDLPLSGEVYYYLVRAQNACGEGGLGVGHPLNPRIGPSCP